MSACRSCCCDCCSHVSQRKKLVEPASESPSLRHALQLISQKRFGFGAACIFLYVGAEVAIGSLIVSYLMRSDVLGLGAEAAGKHVIFYWVARWSALHWLLSA